MLLFDSELRSYPAVRRIEQFKLYVGIHCFSILQDMNEYHKGSIYPWKDKSVVASFGLEALLLTFRQCSPSTWRLTITLSTF